MAYKENHLNCNNPINEQINFKSDVTYTLLTEDSKVDMAT